MKKKLNCILLIDDNADDNLYNQIIIEKMDIAEYVITAENGMEAIKYLSENKESIPDLILLDMNMPQMNGWEFLEAYKKLEVSNDHNQNVVVLATTLTPEDQQKASQMQNLSEMNIKPLTPEMLKKIIELRKKDVNASE